MSKYLLKSLKPAVFSLAVAILFPPQAGSTAQETEILYYQGEKYELCATPLQVYFETYGRNEAAFRTNMHSTANWRGYVATWSIERDSLWLLKVEVEHRKTDSTVRKMPGRPERREVAISDIIPGEKAPVFADWYTGELRVPMGGILRYINMGFGSIHERDLLIQVEAGNVTGATERDNYGLADFRSDLDLAMCAIDSRTIDTGVWIDARLVPTPYMEPYRDSGKTFRTRGFLSGDNKPPYGSCLSVDCTPKTDQVDLPLYGVAVDSIPLESRYMEIEAKFDNNESCRDLQVVSCRALERGETIHASAYPAIIDSLEKSGAIGVVFRAIDEGGSFDSVICEQYECFVRFRLDSAVTVTWLDPQLIECEGSWSMTATLFNEDGYEISSARTSWDCPRQLDFEDCVHLESDKWYRLYMRATADDLMTIHVLRSMVESSQAHWQVLYSGAVDTDVEGPGCISFELIGSKRHEQ